MYQLGNNPGHVFVLRAALRYPGVVVLHDPRILYLYQVAGTGTQDLYDLMIASNPRAAEFARAAREDGRGPTRVDHVLFDALAEVLQASRAIVVHSDHARQLIRRHHGEAAAAKVSVIPHFAYTPANPSREAARAALNLDRNAFVVVTAGFVHRRKRYEWLIEALDQVAQTSARPVIWIQAGELREEEVPLSALLDRFPAVKAISRVTGYLSESDLDTTIAAADVLVNLRFPSEGESSGSLARAFGNGTCCLVSDTAAFKEIPADVAVKIPTIGAPGVIAAALTALSADPALRDAFGRRAARYAATDLSMDRYIARFCEVIDGLDAPAPAVQVSPARAALHLAPDPIVARPRLAEALAAHPAGIEVVIGPIDAATDARPLLAALVPERADARHVRAAPVSPESSTGEAAYEIRLHLCRKADLRHAPAA
ncbi:glycosyltransferase family 4 protein [Methylobacterium sp. ID0610]|uniref:glycosyltransferase family 4 protein n=1 Tax=Methylobacterium carpenticola TaxID=3344827 RepID=UPI00367C61AD